MAICGQGILMWTRMFGMVMIPEDEYFATACPNVFKKCVFPFSGRSLPSPQKEGAVNDHHSSLPRIRFRQTRTMHVQKIYARDGTRTSPKSKWKCECCRGIRGRTLGFGFRNVVFIVGVVASNAYSSTVVRRLPIPWERLAL